MKGHLRVVFLVLLVGLVFSGGFQGTPAEAHHMPGPCDLHWWKEWREHRNVRPIKAIIRCAASRWGVDPDRAVRVASCETGGTFRPTATSPSGTYRGIFQHSRYYWPGRYDAFTRARWRLWDRIYNPRTQAIVTARMVARHGWSAWSCA